MDLNKSQLADMLRRMWEIRYFEQNVKELFMRGMILGATHVSIGEEGTAVGACTALDTHDYITSTHRGHGHCLAKGGQLKPMMAELMGKATGYCRGKGGSMHIADLDLGILGANGIVGGGLTLSAGAALSCQLLGNGRITLCFFGDGAMNQGGFYEGGNLAAIWKLPLVYFCENNQYALSTPLSYDCAITDLAERAAGLGFPGVTIDGNDVLAVYETVAAAAKRARAGDGPTLINAVTYRWEGHTLGDAQSYRTRQEVDEWKKKDPIARFEKALLERGALKSEAEARQIEDQARRDVEEAVEYAKASPEPSVDSLHEGLYVE
jgi:TPP-dependent pyruvate/acetoin dehydrogenase alpha subunit